MPHLMVFLKSAIFCCALLCMGTTAHATEVTEANEESSQAVTDGSPFDRIISKIEIARRAPNKYITAASIYNALPFHEGTKFNKWATNKLLKQLYALDIFEQIEVRLSVNEDGSITLYIIVDEEPELGELIIRGCTLLTEKDIEEKLQTEKIRSISPRKVEMLKRKLLAAYRKKNHHDVMINSTYEVVDGKATVILTVDEGPKAVIRRVFFKGNKCVSDKRLKQIMNTQEDWLFGFITNDGNYNPEIIEKDRRNIELYYKFEGYYDAEVVSVEVVRVEDGQFQMTVTVNEGELYSFGEIHAQSNDLLPEKFLLSQIPAKAGEVFSSKKVYESMEAIKKIWGQFGYVYVEVQPIITADKEKRLININFESELGDRVFARRIKIVGNMKTRDKVIRRKLLIQEGDLVTNNKLEGSKERVHGLSFFDTKEDGVEWKMKRVNDKEADLELRVKEARTGRIALQMGYGGSPDNPNSASQGFSVAGSIMDTNFLGLGTQISLSSNWSPQEWTASATYVDPYFMDKPVLMETNAHYTKTDRGSELHNVKDAARFFEKSTGVSVGSGYLLQGRFTDILTRASVGIEGLMFSEKPIAIGLDDPNANALTVATSRSYQAILDMRFQPGTIIYLQAMMAQDMRNHVYHPSRGYQWTATLRVGAPLPPSNWVTLQQEIPSLGGTLDAVSRTIAETSSVTNPVSVQNVGITETVQTQTNAWKMGLGYVKFEVDASWYTPLIGDRWLIFMLHGHAGIVHHLSNFVIPFRELYHIGGSMTVRGWDWGQIGPTFMNDSIGASRAFYINAELIFPIKPDFSIKGCVFYDGGSGWGSPGVNLAGDVQGLLRNNDFDYRHCIGLGIRMLQPQPIRIDWGLKLDTRRGESHTAVHFGTYREF